MGRSLEAKDWAAEDQEEFSHRLEVQLQHLREQIQLPSFNRENFSLGAELEVYLVDEQCAPICANEEIMALANQPQLSPEINRYNLELNFSPVEGLGQDIFSPIEEEMEELLNLVQSCGEKVGANAVPIGILPTLQKRHLRGKYMTDRVRYRRLEEGLRGPDRKHYRIDISGKDHLQLQGSGISVEGANTSFQVHLRLPANRFTDYFNAAQFTAPILLGLVGNSPLVVGHRLWQESRIALFKQSVDFRDHQNQEWRRPPRVCFGHGWARKEAWELFAESVALYRPLLPILFDEDKEEDWSLPELNLHHGTVWAWNRAVYGPGEEGHLRIEFRTLPAGPSVIDMMANMALAVGLTLGVVDEMEHYCARMPFRFVEYNFYRAAQHGPDAQLIWPNAVGGCFRERPIMEVIEQFLPRARAGLEHLTRGRESAEVDRLWKVIEERFERRVTGASWQLDRFESYRKHHSVEESCRRVVADYQDNLKTGQQVSNWC